MRRPETSFLVFNSVFNAEKRLLLKTWRPPCSQNTHYQPLDFFTIYDSVDRYKQQFLIRGKLEVRSSIGIEEMSEKMQAVGVFDNSSPRN